MRTRSEIEYELSRMHLFRHDEIVDELLLDIRDLLLQDHTHQIEMTAAGAVVEIMKRVRSTDEPQAGTD